MEEKQQPKQKPESIKPSYTKDENPNFKYIVRIANADIDGKKQLIMGLQKIKGVSFMLANAFCNIVNINKNKRIGDLSDEEINKLDSLIKNKKPEIPSWLYNRRKDPETGEDSHLIGAELSFSQESDIRMMKKIKCYKGVRHMQSAPVRGQRTRSNFRKNKGKVTSVKRSVIAKAASKEKEKAKEKK